MPRMRRLIPPANDPFIVPQVGVRVWSRGCWPASWVACAETGEVALYRRRFTWPGGRLQLHLSADQRYEAFLDGVRFASGPERGDLGQWHYESHDLDLPAGEHLLVARVWCLAVPPMAQISQRHGWLCAAEGADRALLNTGHAAWEARPDRAWRSLPHGDAWGCGSKVEVTVDQDLLDAPLGGGTGWSAVRTLAAANIRWNGREAGQRIAHQMTPATLPEQAQRVVRAGAVRHLSTCAIESVVRAADHRADEAAAWQALLDDAFACGYMALGVRAGQRLAQLEGRSVEPPDDLDTPFGKMRFEEAIANDTARACMAAERFDAALAALADFDHVSLRNNAALIHFHRGDVAGALAGYEDNWRREPRNLFALEHIVRLRLWTRGLDFAAGLAAPLKATPAARADDALAKIHALSILGDWQGADAAWRESARADFWQGAHETVVSGIFDFVGGIAALRLGDFTAMSARFADAAKNQPERRGLIQRIERAASAPDSGDAPDVALGELNQWFPKSWIARLTKLKALQGQEAEDRYDALMRACDAHPDYLGVVAELGGEAGRFLAISILKLRAKGGDAAARRCLVDLLARPCGPDKARTGLHADLVDSGLLPEGGTVRLLAHGQVREIRHLAMRIHAEAGAPDLPPPSHARLEQAFGLVARNKLKEGMAIIEELIAKHPEIPSLYNNLAGIKEGLGHPDDEVEALLENALALDPSDLFAISGLARIAARRGENERARTLLAPLLGRPSYHFTEWRSILMTQVVMARRLGEFGVAESLRKQIESLREQFE